MDRIDHDIEIQNIRNWKKEGQIMKNENEDTSVITVRDEDYDGLINNEQIVVVDFWAPWCQPCNMISPTYKEIAEKYQTKAVFAKMNVDENKSVPGKLGITNIPTILFFKRSKLVDRLVGVITKDMLEMTLQHHLEMNK